jgi:hypothetical protein
LYTVARYFIYMKLFYCVHLSAFFSWLDEFHNIIYWPDGMSLFQQVLCKSWLLCGVLVISEMFRKSCVERSICLPHVLYFTIWACELVHTAVFELIFLRIRIL